MTSVVIPAEHRPLLDWAAALLTERGVTGWLVGGYVRDLLRGVPGNDLDIVVDGPAIALAREFADLIGGAFVLLDETTDAARVVLSAADKLPLVVDLVGLRAPAIEQDLRLRDFTINALAVPLSDVNAGMLTGGQLLDPMTGLQDLVAKIIRQCSPAALHDDPLRMLRAVRFAAQLDFAIEAGTAAAIKQHASMIDGVARERVRDEFLKLLAARRAAPLLVYLDQAGLLTKVIPELEAARNCAQPAQHFLPVLEHLFETVAAWEWLFAQLAGEQVVVDVPVVLSQQDVRLPLAVWRYPQLSADLPDPMLLRQRMAEPMLAGQPRAVFFKLAALLHDVGKPQTKRVRADGRITFYDHQEVGAELVGRIAQRLRLGREATAYVQLIVREHMRPGQLRALGPELSRRAVYRLLRDTGAAMPDVLLHSLCDHLAARGPELSLDDWAHHLAWTGTLLQEDWVTSEKPQVARLVTGTDIIRELQVAPGPIIGRVLAAIAEAQFVGEVQTRDDALALAARLVRSDSSPSTAEE